MTAVKPMLAKAAPADLSTLRYPLIVQPKFDGIRALIVDGVVQSRSGKPIPNAEIQAALGRPEFNGLDGELCVGPTTAGDLMQRTTEFVMSSSKTGAAWTYQMFDVWDTADDYAQRWDDATRLRWPAFIGTRFHVVQSAWVHSSAEVAVAESSFVQAGYEGAILRDPRAAYKHGRSGSKGPLLKLKRFIDFEAEVIGVEELMSNQNERKRDAFGRTDRSTAKAGMVPAGVLGKLVCRTADGVEFGCGTGFTAEQRTLLWHQHQSQGTPGEWGYPLIGRIAKIKSFPVGVKDAPRFPVFLGFRDPLDMS